MSGSGLDAEIMDGEIRGSNIDTKTDHIELSSDRSPQGGLP